MPDNYGVEYTNPPQSRNEAILNDTINGVAYTEPAQSRIEALLKLLNALIITGGGSPSVINLKALGAAGDGDTDDTEAVKEAIRQAASSGMPLYIPEGQYLVEWGKIVINTINENGLTIIGDGMFKSVIKMKPEHYPDTQDHYGNGIILDHRTDSGVRPNILMSNICVRWDGDASTHGGDGQSRLLGLYGYFDKVYINNCYFHVSCIEEESRPDSCVFVQLSADIIAFKNCIFENFTNRQIGGGVWIMPDWYDNGGHYVYGQVKQVIVQGNEFRTSNEDEALTLYPSYENKTSPNCFRDVFIDGNTFKHKNWLDSEEDPYASMGLVTVFVDHDEAPVVDGNIVISNNTLESDLANQELIRVVGFTGVDISNNHIVVNKTSLNKPNEQSLRILTFGRNTKGAVRDNYFDFTKITTIEVRLSMHATAEATWKNNTIITGGNFGVSASSNLTSGSILSFEENAIYPLNNAIVIIRKNAEYAKMFVYNNSVYGNAVLNYINGPDFILRGNHFNANTGSENNYEVVTDVDVTGTLDFEMNDGMVLYFKQSNVKTKIEYFKYMGTKSGLKFRVNGADVEDSPEARAVFFEDYDITYIDDVEINPPLTGYEAGLVSFKANGVKYRIGAKEDYYPEYARVEMEEVAAKIEGYIASINNPIIIGFNTDQHLFAGDNDVSETAHAVTMDTAYGLRTLRDLTKRFPFNLVVLGGDAGDGDTISKTQQDVLFVTDQLSGANCPYVHLVGNHDGGQFNSSLTRDQAFKSHVTPCYPNRTVTMLNRTSAYLDDPTCKVRFVFVESYQRSGMWALSDIKNILTKSYEGLPLDYKMIIFSHYPLSEYLNSLWSISDGLACSLQLNRMRSVLIACFDGHLHRDMQGDADRITFVSTTCAAANNNNHDGTIPRPRGTANATAYDVFVIDTDNEVIHAVRYGDNVDRTISFAHAYEPVDPPRGNVLSGITWTDDYRNNASGGTTAQSGYSVSDIFAVNSNDTIYFADGLIPIDQSAWEQYDDLGRKVKDMEGIDATDYGYDYNKSYLTLAFKDSSDAHVSVKGFAEENDYKKTDPTGITSVAWTNAEYYPSGYLKSIVVGSRSGYANIKGARICIPTSMKATADVRVNEPFT